MKTWDFSRPLAISFLAVICYWNSLNCGLVFDDLAAIRDNRDVRPHVPLSHVFFNDFWGMPIRKEQSHKSYRPLTVLSFRLNYFVHGLAPYGYHLVNVFLHAAVCLLFHRVCLLLLPASTAFVAASGFAVHPIHTEAVTGVVGRAELLSALLYLSAFLFHVRRERSSRGKDGQHCLMTAALAGLGMLCKEQAITVLLLCILYELITAKVTAEQFSSRMCRKERPTPSPWLRRSVRRSALLVLCAIVLLCLRVQLVGPHPPAFSRLENPASVSGSPNRQLTYNYLLAVNAWLLLAPKDLCCDWTMASIPVIKGLGDARNLATLAFYSCFFFIFRVACQPERIRLDLAMSLSMLMIPFLPASNLLFPVGFVVAERVLYLPSMGFCMLVAQGWTTMWERSGYRNLMLVGLLLLLFVHVWKTTTRNNDWKDEISLFSSALSVNRNNAKLLNNMGQALEAIHQEQEALLHYREATRVQPDDVRGYLNLGRQLTSLNRYQEAEEAYRKAKSLLPHPGITSPKDNKVTSSQLQVFLHLASLVAQNHSRLQEADDLYRQAINLRADFTNAYLSRGDVLLRMNRTKEAEAMYKRALHLDEDNPDLYFNLGVIVMDQGRTDEALQLFNKALEIDPDHEKALINSAVLIQEAGLSNQRSIAINRLQKVVQKGQESERIYFNLGMLALENSDSSAAELWFRRAMEMNPNSSSTIFNLALLLSDSSPSESLLYLDLLLQAQPNHVKGLLLLGDIYVTHIKDLDSAEECYRRVLHLEPGHMQGLHNLCVVLLERGELDSAERCFSEAASLYPSVRFIHHHLEVTRGLLRDGGRGRYGLQEITSSTAIR